MKRIEHKRLAALLRIGLVIAAVVCAAIFFWFLPELGRGIAEADPEFAWAFWPCLAFAWLFAVPVFWAMALMWAVFGRIGRGEAFCRENARALRTVSRLAFCDAVLVPVGVIVLGLLGLHCAELHGDLNQTQRLQALDRFAKKEVDFLLATDVAARGLDIKVRAARRREA